MPLGTVLVGRAIAHRCKRGLYARKQVQFGNKVSEDGGNRTKRKWLPNAHRKRLFSEQLKTFISFQVTAAALRSIDKAGGLDNYVRKIKGTKEDSQGAIEVRNRLGDNSGLREQQEAQDRASKAQQTAGRQKKRRTDRQLRVRQLEEARRKVQQRSRAETEDSKSGRNDSTLGWLKNRLSSGFRWK